MIQAPRLALALFVTLAPTLPASSQTSSEQVLTQLIQDLGQHREKGYVLTLPQGVDARYTKRLEDVSERRYEEETRALAAFEARLRAIDPATLNPSLQTDAEIISRQLRDRLAELRFRAFEMPIGSREGFHFELAALPDKYN